MIPVEGYSPTYLWREVCRIWVPGIPAPGGSKTSKVIFRNGQMVMKNGRPLITTRDAGGPKNADWKRNVAFFAQQVYAGAPLDGTLKVDFTFYMPRTKGHYGTGRNQGVLKANAPEYHNVKPDCGKLIRSTEDACTGIVWVDDARIAMQNGAKLYAGEESNGRTGAQIVVSVYANGESQ